MSHIACHSQFRNLPAESPIDRRDGRCFRPGDWISRLLAYTDWLFSSGESALRGFGWSSQAGVRARRSVSVHCSHLPKSMIDLSRGGLLGDTSYSTAGAIARRSPESEPSLLAQSPDYLHSAFPLSNHGDPFFHDSHLAVPRNRLQNMLPHTIIIP